VCGYFQQLNVISNVVCQTVKSIANQTKIHRKKHRKKARESKSETEESSADKESKEDLSTTKHFVTQTLTQMLNGFASRNVSPRKGDGEVVVQKR
jgi:pyrroloquinoline quinone (PQQ) biosynthesis protein C